MNIVVICNEAQQDELNIQKDNVVFIREGKFISDSDVLIDLRDEWEQKEEDYKAALIVRNNVTGKAPKTNKEVIDIAGWSGFLSMIEAKSEKKNDAVFEELELQVKWTPDGFISPRIIASIIHEARLALNEGVSTKEEINTAMKLGTAYPYGPFEWEEKIGKERVDSLLDVLKK